MSDDYKAERVFGVGGASEFPGGYPMPRRRGYRAYGGGTAPHSSLDEHDVASVLGVPVQALTPEMLAKLQKLLHDASDLRHQLDVAQHHRRQLEDQADLYPGLPCLNGHAFVRELDAFLREQSSQSAEDWGHLAVIHVAGGEAAAGQWGMEAGQAILYQVWDRLHGMAQDGEPLACWGLGGFSWLLIGPESEVLRRVQSAQDALSGFHPIWENAEVTLTVTVGAAPLLKGQGAEQALSNADLDRIG